MSETQYDLDKQTPKALSLRNVSKNGVLTGEDVLPEKDLSQKLLQPKYLHINH